MSEKVIIFIIAVAGLVICIIGQNIIDYFREKNNKKLKVNFGFEKIKFLLGNVHSLSNLTSIFLISLFGGTLTLVFIKEAYNTNLVNMKEVFTFFLQILGLLKMSDMAQKSFSKKNEKKDDNEEK